MNAPAEITEDVLLAELPRDREGREVLRVNRALCNGYPFIGLRIWSREFASGEYRPTKKGLTLRPRDLPKLLELLAAEVER